MLRWLMLALGLAVTSCQAIADIETHEPDPLPTKCELPKWAPGTNFGRARLTNVFPGTQNIDVCARTSGSASYGRPVFRSAGLDKATICGKGLEYASATAPFRVSTGQLDFKVIPAGKTCSAPALAEKTGVEVGTDLIVTLVYAGPAEGPATLWSMVENNKGTAQNRQTRLVNAMAGQPIIWGVGNEKALPTNLSTPLLNTPLSFGQLPAMGMEFNSGFKIDAYGYVEYASFPLSYGGAIPTPGETKPKMIFLGNLDGAGFWTLYAIGGTDAYPTRGLFCRDSEDNGELQTCDRTEIEAFKVDVFNAGLYGAFAVVESFRAKKVIEDLAARGAVSDLLCVSEVARHDEVPMPPEQKAWTQEALINAAKAVPNGFQYFAQSTADVDTPPTEPKNKQDEEPDPNMMPPRPIDPPGRAACDSQADQAAVAKVYDCLVNKCNTEPGRDTGITAGGVKCYSDQCGPSALAALIFGSPAENQCFNCIVLNGISYIPWGEVKTRCATDKRRPFAWGGTSTSLLLSKYKLTDVEQYVSATSAFRRVQLYAKMQYEAEKSIDVYCIHAPPLLGALMPYTGGYGSGTTGAVGWQEESIWGIQQIIGWIQRKSQGRPAIIMGDWSASATARDKDGNIINGQDGRPMIGNVSPEGILQMQASFFEAITDDMKQQCNFTTSNAVCRPQCTRCPKKDLMDPTRLGNPYNTIEDPIWNLRVYIKDPWVTNPTQSVDIFYKDLNQVVFPELTEFGPAGPLADSFGFRVNIRRP
jgi:hypothetical protein